MSASYRILLFSSAVLAVAGCHKETTPATVPVETVKARLVISEGQESATVSRATGTLHAKENATLSAQVVGSVRQVLVQEGDPVRAGQTLMILNDASYKDGVDQAQAGVLAAEKQKQAAQSDAALAESTLARFRQLQQQKSVSPQEMDEVSRRAEGATARVSALQAQVDAMQAQEAGAKTTLSYTRIRAPFNGVISVRMADPGTVAAPGVPLLQLEGAGALQLQVSVDESAIGKVHRGMKIVVHVDGAVDVPTMGTVSEVQPAADAASHSFLVKIDLPQAKQLKAGMYGSAELDMGSHAAIKVAASACVQRGSLHYVYVLDSNNIAQLRAVTVGSRNGSLVEVLSGLSANEKVVDQPGDRDLNGKRIEAQ
ncbi:efflux RND transporter periplasmic adaptor subunit [Telmatobacter bradus]|uniref:efflux RND transporter periplasmic adaptor subunit n=1 Tax=Telmatobacter bradus TaxID=474953 RepID=UPI003B42E16A